jgi:hypothetical protein
MKRYEKLAEEYAWSCDASDEGILFDHCKKAYIAGFIVARRYCAGAFVDLFNEETCDEMWDKIFSAGNQEV